jgi:RNA polymerase sigma factor (sigma-70 family)
MNARRRELSVKRLTGGPTVAAEDAELPSSSPTPEKTAEVQAQMELIRAALDVLPEPQAEALGQHCILGYTSLEIGETEGVSEEVIRSRLRAARRTLRAMFALDQRLGITGEDFA